MKKNIEIPGERGRIAAILQTPDLAQGRKCPLAVLMHGFLSTKGLEPLKSIARELEKEGVASLRFDFDGHGRSDGAFRDMTVLTEISDALNVYEYVSQLDFVTKIGFLGHSMGGVVGGMAAGKLGSAKVSCLVQMASAAVLKDDALHGVLMGKHYDPENIPDHLRVLFHTVGHNFFEVAQTLPIMETSALYDGPVCLIHGAEDTIVPLSYSKQYQEIYRDGELHVIDGENHIFSKHRREVVSIAVNFIRDKLL